jgi:hypothetical protein
MMLAGAPPDAEPLPPAARKLINTSSAAYHARPRCVHLTALARPPSLLRATAVVGSKVQRKFGGARSSVAHRLCSPPASSSRDHRWTTAPTAASLVQAGASEGAPQCVRTRSKHRGEHQPPAAASSQPTTNNSSATKLFCACYSIVLRAMRVNDPLASKT